MRRCRWCPAILPSLLFTAGCVSPLPREILMRQAVEEDSLLIALIDFSSVCDFGQNPAGLPDIMP